MIVIRCFNLKEWIISAIGLCGEIVYDSLFCVSIGRRAIEKAVKELVDEKFITVRELEYERGSSENKTETKQKRKMLRLKKGNGTTLLRLISPELFFYYLRITNGHDNMGRIKRSTIRRADRSELAIAMLACGQTVNGYSIRRSSEKIGSTIRELTGRGGEASPKLLEEKRITKMLHEEFSTADPTIRDMIFTDQLGAELGKLYEANLQSELLGTEEVNLGNSIDQLLETAEISARIDKDSFEEVRKKESSYASYCACHYEETGFILSNVMKQSTTVGQIQFSMHDAIFTSPSGTYAVYDYELTKTWRKNVEDNMGIHLARIHRNTWDEPDAQRKAIILCESEHYEQTMFALLEPMRKMGRGITNITVKGIDTLLKGYAELHVLPMDGKRRSAELFSILSQKGWKETLFARIRDEDPREPSPNTHSIEMVTGDMHELNRLLTSYPQYPKMHFQIYCLEWQAEPLQRICNKKLKNNSERILIKTI